MWGIITEFFVLITAANSALDVSVTFLTAVPRLNSNSAVDYYFCCHVVGKFLQWEYSNTPVYAFLRTEDSGKVVADKRLDHTYTATLLSSVPVNNNEAEMNSVLVLSFPNDLDRGQFNVSCISNHGSSSTIAGNVSQVKNSDVKGEVQMDYIISGAIVSNHNYTHILMCGVRNTSQHIEVIGSNLHFSRLDSVGKNRTIYYEKQHTAQVQGILITLKDNQIATLIFVTTSHPIVNVSCNDGESWVFLPSHDEVAETKKIPETTTYYNSTGETMINSSKLPAENVTQLTTDKTSTNSLIRISPITIIVFIPVGFIIIITIVAKYRSKIIREQNKRTVEVEQERFPNDTHDSTKSCDISNDKPKNTLKLSILSQNPSSKNSPLTNAPSLIKKNQSLNALVKKSKWSKLFNKPPSSANINSRNEDLSSTTKVDESNNCGSEGTDEDCSSAARKQNNEVEEGNTITSATCDNHVSNNIESATDEHGAHYSTKCSVNENTSKGMGNSYNSGIRSQDAALPETNM